MLKEKKRLIWNRFDWTEDADSSDLPGNTSKKNKNSLRFSRKEDLFVDMVRFDNKSMQILGNGQFGIVYRVMLATEISSKSGFQVQTKRMFGYIDVGDGC